MDISTSDAGKSPQFLKPLRLFQNMQKKLSLIISQNGLEFVHRINAPQNIPVALISLSKNTDVAIVSSTLRHIFGSKLVLVSVLSMTTTFMPSYVKQLV